MAGEAFRIRQQGSGGRYSLILTGELDMGAAPTLGTEITRLCEAGALEIELDLRDLSFIDSTGILVLLTARETCVNHGTDYFLVRGAHPTPERLLKLTGLLDTLPWR